MKIKIINQIMVLFVLLVGSVYGHSLLITTSPYVGLKSAYDGSDLIPNFPSMNEDLFLLRQNKELECNTRCFGRLFADRSALTVGGALEGQFLTGLESKKHADTDLDLTRAELDLLANINPWVTGLVTVAYDNAPLLPSPGGLRVANSRFFLSRGFVTVGNLNQTPVYGTFGQIYVPFGRYASNLLSPPVTLKLGRTTGRALLLGYDQQGLNASIYTFHGDGFDRDTGLNQWGVNLSYKRAYQDYKVNVGASYIANIVDAKGMRQEWVKCGSRGVMGALVKRVPAMDFHGEFSKGPYDLFAEYVGATESFNPEDLNFHYHGARPQAAHLELTYHPKMVKPSTISGGYSRSWQTFNIPEQSWFVVYNTSLLKNTTQGLEYRHDLANKRSNPGKKNSNTVLAQIGFYF